MDRDGCCVNEWTQVDHAGGRVAKSRWGLWGRCRGRLRVFGLWFDEGAFCVRRDHALNFAGAVDGVLEFGAANVAYQDLGVRVFNDGESLVACVVEQFLDGFQFHARCGEDP